MNCLTLASSLFFLLLVGSATSHLPDNIQCIADDSICDDTKEVRWFLDAFPNGDDGDDGHPIHINEGDCVKFNYRFPDDCSRGRHDIVQFGSADDFTSCDFEHGVRVGDDIAAGSTCPNNFSCTIPFPDKGTYWYGCSKGTHCAQGMKVMVSVTPAPANRNLLRASNK